MERIGEAVYGSSHALCKRVRKKGRCAFLFSFLFYAKLASEVMVVFSNFEIGQFFSASFTHSSNFSLLIPGTVPFTIRCDLVTEPFSNVISHLVSRFSGVNPASPKTKLSFIVKQP